MVVGTLMRGTIRTVALGDYGPASAPSPRAAQVGRQGNEGAGEPGAVGGRDARPGRAGPVDQ